MPQHNQAIGKYLKQLRTSIKPVRSQRQLAIQLGISHGLLSRIENGSTVATDKTLAKYSNLFSIPLPELQQIRDTNKLPDSLPKQEEFDVINLKHEFKNDTFKVLNVPYFESISAGIETELTSDYPIEYIPVLLPINKFSSSKNIIAVRVNGDSMNKVVPNHAIVILDTKPSLTNGDVVAYQLDNCFGLKHYYTTNNSLILEPDSTNEDYKTKIIPLDELNIHEFNIIGKMITQFSYA